MKKVILDFNVPDSKEKVIEYIIEKFELPDYYSKNLDALYDYLTELSEPTAVGFFMPTPEYEEIDIDYLMYIEEIKRTFLEAERDGDNLAVILGDLTENYEDSEAIDDLDSIFAELREDVGDAYLDWNMDDFDEENDDNYDDFNDGDLGNNPEFGDDYNDIDLFGAFRK